MQCSSMQTVRARTIAEAQVLTTVWAFYTTNGYDAEAAKAGEIKHAQNAISAAVDAGVKHIVYSTLDGRLGCDHWDSKAEGEHNVTHM